MNTPIGLDSLFKEKLFRIPDYQRGYAWQKPQLKDFWEDLVNLQNDRSHYTGVLTLKEIPPQEVEVDSNEYWLVEDHSYKMYHIVDGQQRLTTCIIFIQCLVEVIRSISRTDNGEILSDKDIYLTDSLSLQSVISKFLYKQKPTGDKFITYKFGYTADNPSYKYMRYRILAEADAGMIDETFYTLNLKNAKAYFIGQLEAYYLEEGIKGLQDIYKKLSKKFLFNEYIIKDEFDVFVAFETMNNRGKNLSNLELLKNRLIYLTTLYPDNELDAASRKNLRDEINDAWKEVYFQLGRNDKKPLNDDDFLKAHWIVRFMYSRKKGDDYINFLLNEYFSPKNIHKKVEKEVIIETPEEQKIDQDFLEDEENIDEIKVISISALSPVQIRDYVRSLKSSALHWFNSYYPFLAIELTPIEQEYIDKLNRIGMGYFRPLIMSLLKNESVADKRILVMKKIERFIFIVFYLSQVRRNYGDSEFYNAARELDQHSISSTELINRLSNKESFTFNDDGTFKTKYFNDYMYKKFNIGGRFGFYHWHGIRYFLYEYELKKMEGTGQLKVTWDLFIKNETDKISIEHIFPQSITEYWAEAFKAVPEEQLYLYRGSLGNLLLLSQSINSSLQNDSYAEKKLPKFSEKNEEIRKGYANGSHSEIEVSLKYNKWTPIEIKDRGLKLLDFMEERWNINLGNNLDKCLLLNLCSPPEI
jgi:uncharacterized protein with ParB-like and HNH nuclease domain